VKVWLKQQFSKGGVLANLPDAVHKQIEAHCTRGDELANRREFQTALKEYAVAWDLLPEPKTNWEAALWILTAIGDAHFLSGNWQACRKTLQQAVKACDGALENPFIRLRLGQSLFELGEQREAADWMVPAFLMEGKQLFAAEDPKYLASFRGQLQPPPEGWPEGW
jgi:tetratricopeptide (TPR) repeat protein